jgi:hypothetical protein
VTYFEYDTGSELLSGWVDYDDAEVDASMSSQSLDLTDVGFLYNGEEYELADLDTGATVEFAYGRVVGFTFSTAAVGNNPALDVTAASGTLTVDDGEDEYPFDVAIHNYDALVLDTTDTTTGSGFEFTLSDGTVARGVFVMDSEDVPYQGGPIPALEDGTYLVAVTSFTLEVGSATFTESDCTSTPMARFDANFNFIGLNYSIQNITGQPFTAITSSNGVVTITFASAPTQVKPAPMLGKYVNTDTSKFATGEAYRITIKTWTPGGGAPVGTAVIEVAANDNTAMIRDKIIKALQKAGIFVKQQGNSDSLTIAGRQNDNIVGQSLSKISIETEKQDLFGWYYDDLLDWQNGLRSPLPKPIGLFNGQTITIPGP